MKVKAVYYTVVVHNFNLQKKTTFDFLHQLKTEQISAQLPDDFPSGMKQVVALV